jgi:hypothetical protein
MLDDAALLPITNDFTIKIILSLPYRFKRQLMGSLPAVPLAHGLPPPHRFVYFEADYSAILFHNTEEYSTTSLFNEFRFNLKYFKFISQLYLRLAPHLLTAALIRLRLTRLQRGKLFRRFLYCALLGLMILISFFGF